MSNKTGECASPTPLVTPMIVLTEIYTSLAPAQTLNVFTENIIKMEIETQLKVLNKDLGWNSEF